MQILANNTPVRVPLSLLDGANVWLLRNISAAANVTFLVDIIALPGSYRTASDRGLQLDYVFNRNNFSNNYRRGRALGQ